MNNLKIQSGCSGATSVSFLPATAEVPSVAPQTVEYLHRDLVERIARELRIPLSSLYGRVRSVSPGARGTVVSLTSFGRRMGCTTAALALALIAKDECHAIVVDGDGATRGLSAGLASAPQAGWDDSVRGITRPNRTFHEFAHWPRLAILPIRTAAPEADVLVSGSRVPRLLAELRGEFDLIVIDGGTLHGTGHLWAPWVDAALLVCDASQSRSSEWTSAWDILEEKGANVLGVIETFA